MDNLSHASAVKKRAYQRIERRSKRARLFCSGILDKNAQHIDKPEAIQSCSMFLKVTLSLSLSALFFVFSLVVYLLIGVTTLLALGFSLTILPLVYCLLSLQNHYQNSLNNNEAP